jgi:hypothetical protein
MNDLTKFLVDGILKEETQGITVMIPGGFKPPHEGHLMLAKGYNSMPNVNKVVILITPKERDGITVQDSKSIWNTLLMGIQGIEVREVTYPSPLTAAYEFVKNDGKEGDVFALGASSKGSDYNRVADFVKSHQEGGKYFKPGVSVVELPFESSKPLVYKGRTDDKNGSPISASQLRADLAADDFANFKTNYPSVKTPSQIQAIYDLLKKKSLTERVIVENQITDFVQKLRGRFKLFLQSIAKEGRLTKEAFYLAGQAAIGKKQLTPQEKGKIGNQLKEALKSAGLIAASVLPGGMIYFIVIRLLRIENYVVPNSFAGKNTASIALVAEHELLTEGGAAGHMAHPYEDSDLTFEDIENMIEAALTGKVEYAQEKLDGQNLMVTYKDGKVLSARNKGQLKNAAEKAMSKSDMETSMAHLPDNVKNSFLDAMGDMEAAINKLTPAEKEEYFGNGTKFVNMEVLHPASQNVAAYGVTELRMHNIQEYDNEGNVINSDANAPAKIQQALQRVKATKQSTYDIKSTDMVSLKKTADYEKQKAQLIADLSAVQKKYNLTKSSKLGLYFQNAWTDYIKEAAREYQYDIPDDVLQNIVNRWAFGFKTPDLRQLKQTIDSPEFLQWFVDTDKGPVVRDEKKRIVEPVEDIFLKLGVFVLKSLEGLVAINPNDSIAQMKGDLANAIEAIQQKANNSEMGDDDAPMKFLKHQLKRLDKIGGFDAIVPSEGIVFKHNGKLYKLTGAFAPINQIIGYIKFAR